jgi:glycosyltransferase involved in cell wall biosynthesis
MKVLIVHPMFHVYGGAELAIVRLIEYLKSKEHSVDLLTMVTAPDVKKDIKADNIFYANNIQELQQLLNGIYINYDVVNYHNHPVELFIEKPHPSVWFMNEPPDCVMDGNKLDQKEVDQVKYNITKIAVSDTYNKGRVLTTYGRNDAIVIPYGVDYDYFDEDTGSRWFFETVNKFTILQAAWMHPRKNQMKVLETLNEIKDSIPNIKVILCGRPTSPYINQLIEYIEKNKLQNYVTLDGTFGDKPYLRRLYHSVDVLLQPVKDQGGWISPLEAIVSGLPAIISEEAVFSNYFKGNKLATVTSDYKTAILDIYNNKEKYKQLNIDAKAYIKANLTWEQYGEKVEKLLKSAVDESIPKDSKT